SRGPATDFLVAAPDTSKWCCTGEPHGTFRQRAFRWMRDAGQAAGSSATRNGLRCLTHELKVTGKHVCLRALTRTAKSLLAQASRVVLWIAFASACRSLETAPKRQTPDAGKSASVSEKRVIPALATRGERPARDATWFVVPPEQPWQLLALS